MGPSGLLILNSVFIDKELGSKENLGDNVKRRE